METELIEPAPDLKVDHAGVAGVPVLTWQATIVVLNKVSLAYRRGRTAAVSATARKLAVIIWTMITKKIAYIPPTEYLFPDQKRKAKVINKMKRNIAKLDIKPEDVGFVIT